MKHHPFSAWSDLGGILLIKTPTSYVEKRERKKYWALEKSIS